VHYLHVGKVAVGERYQVDLVLPDEFTEFGFRVNGNAVGIEVPRARRIETVLDGRDLSCSEGDDVVTGLS
jgi:hypothetical protein